MKYLIVGAHPDDEVLGAGATIHKAATNGDEVYVCLLSHKSPTRHDDLLDGIKKSHEILGVKKSYLDNLITMRFKDADRYEIVQFIENAIMDCQPDILITHNSSDNHPDHGIVTGCCLEAARLPQRQLGFVNPIKCILTMEVASSTEWGINPAKQRFIPNTYIDVNGADIIAKIKAVDVYEGGIRKKPHPRSVSVLSSVARVRGSESGLEFAEAFQSIFRLGV